MKIINIKVLGLMDTVLGVPSVRLQPQIKEGKEIVVAEFEEQQISLDGHGFLALVIPDSWTTVEWGRPVTAAKTGE